MDRKRLIHEGINFTFDGRFERIDFPSYTDGKVVTVYGQTEVTHGLMKAGKLFIMMGQPSVWKDAMIKACCQL